MKAKVVAATKKKPEEGTPDDRKVVNDSMLKFPHQVPFAKRLRLSMLLKRPAACKRSKYEPSGKPAAHHGGRIHWAAKHHKYRVYKRSAEKVEECITVVDKDEHDRRLKCTCALSMIEDDPATFQSE